MPSVDYILLPFLLLCQSVTVGRGWLTKLLLPVFKMPAERVILNGRDATKTVEATAATATDLMNRLNRIMTSLKADHIQARFTSIPQPS